GLFGIYIFMIFFRKSLIDQANAQIIKTIFVIGLVMTFITPRINIAAHIFGFIGGFALGPLLLVGVLPFSIARYRKLTFKSESDSNEISFNPDRWKRKSFVSKSMLKKVLWIVLGVLVILGLVSQLI